MSESTRGILLFAENNDRINYLKLAILSALCVKNNLGKDTKVSVVTNHFSLAWLDNETKEFVENLFDKIIISEDPGFDGEVMRPANMRVYRDTQYYSVTSQFLNHSRSNAYSLTPYDETLLVDVDYFILNDQLNSVWGCNEDFLINKSAKSLLHEELTGPEFRLNPFGIRMYWATLIYFKKTEKAKLVFDLVEHVKDAWNYYKHVYDFPGDLYRNDFAFSIALHMLNGFSSDDDFVKSFPDPSILTAIDTDQFIDFDDKQTARLFANDPVVRHNFYVSKIKEVNFHCLNKISILNKYSQLLEKLK